MSSCGYHIVGSRPLPFDSVTIAQVRNMTYEPRLEDKLHRALSREFILQGINVMSAGGDVVLETAITSFELSSIAAVDNRVKEQMITMKVDVRIRDEERIIEFKSMESPIRITFQTTGSVAESALHKENASEKACREISREIIGKIITRYAK